MPLPAEVQAWLQGCGIAASGLVVMHGRAHAGRGGRGQWDALLRAVLNAGLDLRATAALHR